MAEDSVVDKARKAREAAHVLSQASDEQRRRALETLARRLEDQAEEIENANQADLDEATKAVEAGTMSQALLDRLAFHDVKLSQASQGVLAVAELEDPIGRTERSTLLDDGLRLFQIRVPIGVVACAFESRPDAGVQMSALAIRSGNAILLKGGSEAVRSNRALNNVVQDALREAGLPPAAVTLIEDRAELQALLDLDEHVDLMIPRGSSDFVRFVQDNTRIPVLGHADGVCHTYIDAAADLEEALEVCLDAKLDYPAACNATECFLVHQAVVDEFAPKLVEALQERGCEVRADVTARNHAPAATEATEEDWGHEWGDVVCALATVGSLQEAIDWIERYGSHHTDAILTEDAEAAGAFLSAVDSAGVFWNASTRFSDGYRYGLGAEVGISTGKVHARGPVGLEGLTTTKWVLQGHGHTAGTYQGEHARPFQHKALGEAWTPPGSD